MTATLARRLEQALQERSPTTIGVKEGDRNLKGIVQLVLTLVKVIHELLQKQAIRRMDEGSLTDEELERVGETLYQQANQLSLLCKQFDLSMEDLEIDLGPWLRT